MAVKIFRNDIFEYITYIKIEKTVLNWKNISQHYFFYFNFNQINLALVSLRNVFKNIKQMNNTGKILVHQCFSAKCKCCLLNIQNTYLKYVQVQ